MSLEASITLEDVFVVVESKRVPLAPELAGYLALEIADGTDAGGGAVDPRTVFISEEGTVALVRPKKEQLIGDAEASVRVLLAKLLEASGSGTPALTTAAKRKPGNGLPALVEELEAALIPVNRAAGRRALARLAREVKRVTLGVGRNASAAPKPVTAAAPHARPMLRRKESGALPRVTESAAPPRVEAAPFPPDEPGTAKRPSELNELALQMNDVDSARAGAPPADGHASPRPPPLKPASLPPPPATKPAAASLPPPPPPKREPTPPPADVKLEPLGGKGALLGGDEVDSLLDSFNVSGQNEDKQVARELKAIAGLDPTPPPPDAAAIADLTKDLPRRREPSIDGDSIEALLAMTDASVPVRPEPAPPPRVEPPPIPAAAPPSEPMPAAAAPPSGPTPASAPLPPSAPLPAATPALADPPRAPKKKEALPPKAKLDPPPKRPRDPRPRAPRTGMALLVLTLLFLVGATAATWKFAPQIFTGKKRPPATATAPTTSAVAPAPKCKVSLAFSGVPVNAEILIRVGQAPVDVERMPMGTRLELIATAEGNVPRRAVIHPDSTWEKGPDGKPRIEVPIQLEPSKLKPGATDPWPPAEPGSQVGGTGAPGTAHVVTNVRGAEIWLLAGLGPEARIEQLRCEGDIDVLLAGPTTFRKRLRVAESEIQAAPADASGNRTVTINAK